MKPRGEITYYNAQGKRFVRAHLWNPKGYSTSTFFDYLEAWEWLEMNGARMGP